MAGTAVRIGIDLRAAAAPSGQQRYLWRLGSWLGRREHEVEFLCTRKDPGETQSPPGCRIHPLHQASGLRLRETVRSLGLNLLLLNPERARRYHGIRANVLRPGYGTEQYRQKLRSFRNPWERGFRTLIRASPPVLMDRRRERRFYEGRNANPDVIAISEYMRREIRRSYRVDPQRLHLVYNGIDLAEFCPQQRAVQREACRREWGIPEDAFCILTMAHNFRLKGVWEVMGRIRRLNLSGLDAHLLVAGGGARRKGQRRKAARLSGRYGISRSVHLPGTVQPAIKAFAAADLLLFPSWHDAFGFVILEAMACGLPVITTPYAGASEIIEDGVSGFIVDPEEPGEVDDRLRLLADSGVRKELGEEARLTAEQYSEEKNFRRVEEILIEAAKRQKGPIA
jgi:glycosyltransferase involved in cell wall biosynthesis